MFVKTEPAAPARSRLFAHPQLGKPVRVTAWTAGIITPCDVLDETDTN
jgi:hypothetical protein